ncbi:SMI1/KNR4 family protein [Pseudoalteromonas luteoviolacea]|uniref:Knr4/Smi1-like domain-containing protein n=1 Tax=Pseudoalteromonas luteoviolacea S4060-1 TaxID=1365257 RepID=A0A167PDA1_9GAMM|nr:SMI1/KNR4 family protein [Pseudoalteromonas luteoviolacea]KZN70394.1 hypothetical protein N478_00390 [Pseudoalteromonas luteoviolacea S4060-1]
MKSEEILKIESELKISVPGWYKQFLLNFPVELINDEEEGVFYSAHVVIDETKSSRDYCEEEWEEPFPKELLSVGWNGGCSCYCIKQADTEQNVYLFCHERGAIDPSETLTLDQFIEAWSE